MAEGADLEANRRERKEDLTLNLLGLDQTHSLEDQTVCLGLPEARFLEVTKKG